MSDDDIPNVEVNGAQLAISFLMCCLRRHVLVSMGFRLDSTGRILETDDSGPVPPMEQMRELMLIVAKQGMRDVRSQGLVPLEEIQRFSHEVVVSINKETIALHAKNRKGLH